MKELLRIGSLFFILLSIISCGGSGETTPDEDDGTNTGVDIPGTGFTSPTSYPNRSLVWEDDFSAANINLSDWTFETGTGDNGWGNNELQYYTANNAYTQEGHLIIEAKEQGFSGSNYTSARMVTLGKQDFRYGRVDIRAVLPKGQGIWPAFWMLGSNFTTVGWPASGEIDIMEMIGGSGRENTTHGTVHWENDGQRAQFGGSVTRTNGTFNDEFHVFSIEWTAASIIWYVDNQQFHAIDTTPAQLDEFRNRFFFIFNLAVGGNWPGSPDNTTTFPQYLIVDYIRVFQ